jgi:hypothetical protein
MNDKVFKNEPSTMFTLIRQATSRHLKQETSGRLHVFIEIVKFAFQLILQAKFNPAKYIFGSTAQLTVNLILWLQLPLMVRPL